MLESHSRFTRGGRFTSGHEYLPWYIVYSELITRSWLPPGRVLGNNDNSDSVALAVSCGSETNLEQYTPARYLSGYEMITVSPLRSAIVK